MSDGRGLTFGRALLGVLFIGAGVLHLVAPERYLGIVPPYLPAAAAIVLISGIAEIAGGAGVMIERYRRAAGVGLIVLLVAVFPANVEMLQQGLARGASRFVLSVLWIRLPIQALLLWWVWATCVRGPRLRAAPPGPVAG